MGEAPKVGDDYSIGIHGPDVDPFAISEAERRDPTIRSCPRAEG